MRWQILCNSADHSCFWRIRILKCSEHLCFIIKSLHLDMRGTSTTCAYTLTHLMFFAAEDIATALVPTGVFCSHARVPYTADTHSKLCGCLRAGKQKHAHVRQQTPDSIKHHQVLRSLCDCLFPLKACHAAVA